MWKCDCEKHTDKNDVEIKEGMSIRHELQGIGTPIKVISIEGILIGKDRGGKMMNMHNFLPNFMEVVG